MHSSFNLIPKPLKSDVPLDALTIFTDGSGLTHKSEIAWQDPVTQDWRLNIESMEGSPQIVELAADVKAFSKFADPFNLIDSAEVSGIVEKAENSFLKTVSNDQLYSLLKNLISILSQRQHPYFVMHTHSHTSLQGLSAEGNA